MKNCDHQLENKICQCYMRKKSKNVHKKRKNENFEKKIKKIIIQGSFNPKIRFLGQKMCPIAGVRTDRQTDGQTHRHTHTKVNVVGTFSGFQKFFLQPIIKDGTQFLRV